MAQRAISWLNEWLGLGCFNFNWLQNLRKRGAVKDASVKGVHTVDARTVLLNGHAQPQRYVLNEIRTSKYGLVNFLPVFLFTMFRRVAYLYFLAQAALAYWSVVSPFSPYGPTIALVVILLVAAIKALIEDAGRHREDVKINNGKARILMNNGKTSETKWRHVHVGDIVEVHDNEDFPADLLCLHCQLEDGVCYIKTTNLDGESNLKIKRPVDLGAATPQTPEDVLKLRGELHCEPPNANLHIFVGRLEVVSSMPDTDGKATVIPVSLNEMLLRGCTLKNSGRVLGLVVYTGPESRIQMNAAAPPRKTGSYDAFLNVQIAIVILFQILLCIGLACGSLGWRNNSGYERSHLQFRVNNQGNYKSNIVYVIVLWITYWILLSYLVPISLFVTMEIVKFLMGLYVNFDRKMKHDATGEFAKARNTDMVEDLGMVEYVFSDKTGTLTSNEMQLRCIALRGSPFGSPDFQLETAEGTPAQRLEQFDERLASAASLMQAEGTAWAKPVVVPSAKGDSDMNGAPLVPAVQNGQFHFKADGAAPYGPGQTNVMGNGNSSGPAGGRGGAEDAQLGQQLLGFWTNICVCHSLISEAHPETGEPIFQGPSPDEVALVEAAKRMGFVFVARARSRLQVNMLGRPATYEILNTLDFTSDRARMSVVVRCPDGTIKLLTKGSDAVMLPLLRRAQDAGALERATQENLRNFSLQGLRTLVLCERILTETEWRDWNMRFQAASAQLVERDSKVSHTALEVERNLDLLGVTAIEDKLQAGVPDAISSLIKAGMKVWVITGDKQETAINIAISCKLIQHPDHLMVCNADSAEEAASLLDELTKRGMKQRDTDSYQGVRRSSRTGMPELACELVIDGKTLSHVLGTPAEAKLAELASGCAAVVVCRASPSQKAAIVRRMKRFRIAQCEGRTVRWIERQRAWLRWPLAPLLFLLKYQARVGVRMLAIGDGANDVAMIQAASIGIGIMGKEGRQATNNSDYAIGQFRFLERLLLVHGTLADYRLSRLIKYSFYKNIAFATTLFLFQFYNGYSGQALVDGITAAFYNAFFTALPVGAFAIFDRPVRLLSTLQNNPQLYHRSESLSIPAFWRTAIALAIVHGAICFFIPYYSVANGDRNSITDLWSVGKTIWVAVIGVVTLEILLVSRYQTKLFLLVTLLSYALVYPYVIILPLIFNGFGTRDPAQDGVGNHIFSSATFWLVLVFVYSLTFGIRFLERSIIWLYRPNDSMILSEMEALDLKEGDGALRRERQIELGHSQMSLRVHEAV
ncbi:hypothetical protein WJX74_009865 [Apatococcus lobatus]|uniref:Phospholipid-transporting ATPase n=2 Tax=Apatococcus TaxID=904362 RepID=A0AAW1T1Q4_9CHLO